MQCLSPIELVNKERFKKLYKLNDSDWDIKQDQRFEAMKKLHPEMTNKEILNRLFPLVRLVPCGKCEACLSRRRTQWVQRLSYELFHSSNSHFITLTYEDDYLIYDVPSHRPVALMSEVSKFIETLKSKLFRKQKNPMKFFAVSEYGPQTLRPHFHLLLFNLPLNVDLRYLEELWYKGNIKVDVVNGARIGYVTKYCLAKSDPGLWCLDDKDYRPQMRCSKNLGIGLISDPVLSKQYRDSLLYDGFVSQANYQLSVPRYYKEKLLSEHDKLFVSEKTEKFAQDHERKLKNDKVYRLLWKAEADSLKYKVNQSIKKSKL